MKLSLLGFKPATILIYWENSHRVELNRGEFAETFSTGTSAYIITPLYFLHVDLTLRRKRKWWCWNECSMVVCMILCYIYHCSVIAVSVQLLKSVVLSQFQYFPSFLACFPVASVRFGPKIRFPNSIYSPETQYGDGDYQRLGNFNAVAIIFTPKSLL